MNDIKVGEYGRTNLGNIFKFAWLEKENGKIDNKKVLLIDGDEDAWNYYYFWKGEKIIRHSKNIIDLIEDKDILKVKTKENEIIYVGIEENTTDVKYSDFIEDIKSGEYKLIGILSHEQFENNYYKVVE